MRFSADALRLVRSLAVAALFGITAGAQVCSYNLTPDAQLELSVERLVRPLVRSNNFSGVVVIGKGDRIFVQQAYGLANVEFAAPNRLDTVFHVASVSKPFTAAAILTLVEDGKLSLDDPLAKYFPGYPRGAEILVRHLLTHASGVVNINTLPEYEELSRSPATLDRLIAAFRDRPLLFAPGSKTSYSNSNYNLLARIVEIASGLNFRDYLEKRIFLGLPSIAPDDDSSRIVKGRASGYVPFGKDQAVNAPYVDWRSKTGNGSLMMNAGDLYRWTCSFHQGAVVGSALMEASRTAQIGTSGFGWFVTGMGEERQVEITGRSPGFTAAVEYFPATRLTVVVLSNSYSALSQNLAADLAKLARGGTVEPALPLDAIATDAASLREARGQYRFGPDFYNPSMKAAIRVEGADAWLDTAGGDKIYLIPASKDSWLDRLYGGTVRIAAAKDGNPKTLVWNFGRAFRAPALN